MDFLEDNIINRASPISSSSFSLITISLFCYYTIAKANRTRILIFSKHLGILKYYHRTVPSREFVDEGKQYYYVYLHKHSNNLKLFYICYNGGIIGYDVYKQSFWPYPIYARQIFIQLPVQNIVPYCADNI